MLSASPPGDNRAVILFLEYSAGGMRGGELFAGHLHGLLKKAFGAIEPATYKKRPPELGNPLRAAMVASRLARAHKPSLIVSDVSSGIRNLEAVRWTRGHGGKALIIVQDQRMQYRLGNFFLLKWLIHRAEKYLMRSADVIVVNSRYMANFASLWARPGTPIVVSHPGFDLSAKTGDCSPASPSDDTFHLLSAGQPDERKGTRYLIEALAELKDLKVHLHVTGQFSLENPYCRMIDDLVDRLGVRKRVTFHGYISREEVDRLYRRSRLFVLGSLSEGYGIAMAEALAYGLPVVATRVAAIPEMIEDGVNGILVPPKDPVALAGAIRKMSEDPGLRERIRQSNLTKARTLPTWDDFDRTLERELVPAIERLLGPKSG